MSRQRSLFGDDEPAPRKANPTARSKAPRAGKVPSSCPVSDSPDAPAFLERWQIPALSSDDGAEVALMLDHHGARGNTWIDWRAVWRTWRTRGQAGGRWLRGPAPGHAKTHSRLAATSGDGEPRPTAPPTQEELRAQRERVRAIVAKIGNGGPR